MVYYYMNTYIQGKVRYLWGNMAVSSSSLLSVLCAAQFVIILVLITWQSSLTTVCTCLHLASILLLLLHYITPVQCLSSVNFNRSIHRILQM